MSQKANHNKVFIGYVREDIEAAERLYEYLKDVGLEPWLDRSDLLPGQKWRPAIRDAIKNSRYFIALFSSNSVEARGYVQKQLKESLDILDEFPSQDIFIIPARLDDCKVSEDKIIELVMVDLFPDWGSGIDKILKAMKVEGSSSNIITQNAYPSKDPPVLKRYPYAKFVSKMQLEKIEPLEVSIKLDPQPNTEAIYLHANPDEKEVVVDVIVYPGTFNIVKGDRFCTIQVPVKPQDSDPVIFFLKAKQEGVQEINIKFFQRGAYLGKLMISTIVEPVQELESLLSDFHTAIAGEAWPILNPPFPGPDVVLYIIEYSRLVYDLRLSSRKYPYKKFGPLTFPLDPETQMRSIFSDICSILK